MKKMLVVYYSWSNGNTKQIVLSSQDFTGKTVIPFMTNGGWPGHVIKDMKANCKGAEFAHEMEIQFDSTGGAHLETPETKIAEWIEAVKKDI